MKCSIIYCEKKAKLYRALNERIKIGALGYLPVAIPLCKEHDSVAYSQKYLESLLKEEEQEEKD